jgi:adenylosuccinate synthase
VGKLMIVVGGQFGSEAKGACAAALAARSDAPLVIRTGGPNAGHTVWGGTPHQEFKLRQLPTAAISNPDARIAIAAGSVVDPDLLGKEIADTHTQRYVLVDEMATVLEPEHVDEEVYATPGLRNWSTQKGIGAARSARIMRKARVWRQVSPPSQTAACDVAHLARVQLQSGGDVIIEAAQGYGLGLHTSFYPKTTSADCRAIDALAAVGLSPWFGLGGLNPDYRFGLEIWVVMRPYPIRVAGESGPLFQEKSWDELGLETEFTTVTNKVRRVGMWDQALAEAALTANGAPSPAVRVWFSMMDQVIPQLKGLTTEDFNAGRDYLGGPAAEEVRNELGNWAAIIRQAGSTIRAIGTGPDSHIWIEGGLR